MCDSVVLLPVGTEVALQENGRSHARIATAFYLITIFFTFFVVFYDKIPDDGRVGIIILCVFVQWIAMLWYTISLHPLRAGLGLHVLLPGAARLLQEARY